MSVPTEGGKKEEFIDGLLNARPFILHALQVICAVQNIFGDIWPTLKRSLIFGPVPNVHGDILF